METNPGAPLTAEDESYAAARKESDTRAPDDLKQPLTQDGDDKGRAALNSSNLELGDPEDDARAGRAHEEYAIAEVDVTSPDDDDWIDPDDPTKIKFRWRTLWRFTGPGWLMSMAYLDPGNLTSDLQQGAYTEYQLLWVLWWSTVAGWILQVLSARLGVVTGRDLAQTCRHEWPKWVCYNLFFQIELAVIGAVRRKLLSP